MVLGVGRGAFNRMARLFRKIPTAYTLGVVILVAGTGLLSASLLSEVGIIAVRQVTGEAPPGTAVHGVPFNETALFQATLVVGSCSVRFHLLSEVEYALFVRDGRLPTPTLDCDRRDAVVPYRVAHMVTVHSAPVGSPNATFGITASIYGVRSPYTILSVPGAVLAMSSTIWIAMTMMTRGTEKLVKGFREQSGIQKKK